VPAPRAASTAASVTSVLGSGGQPADLPEAGLDTLLCLTNALLPLLAALEGVPLQMGLSPCTAAMAAAAADATAPRPTPALASPAVKASAAAGTSGSTCRPGLPAAILLMAFRAPLRLMLLLHALPMVVIMVPAGCCSELLTHVGSTPGFTAAPARPLICWICCQAPATAVSSSTKEL